MYRFTRVKDRRRGKYWKKVGKISAAAGIVLAALFGFWFVRVVWIGPPSGILPCASDDPAYTGEGDFAGRTKSVFLHGPTLARYDFKGKKENLVAGVGTPGSRFAEETTRMEKFIGDLAAR